MKLVALLCIALVAGCVEPLPTEEADDGLPPLPPPRSDVHPDDLIGLDAIQPAGHWKGECGRQWASGAYNYTAPPVVMNATCTFYPTAQGTMYWQILDVKEEYWTQPSTVLENHDGFFDWFIFSNTTLYFKANNSQEIIIDVWDEPPADPRFGLSAARLGNEVHVFVHDYWLRNVPNLHHYWFTDPTDVSYEVVLGGSYFDAMHVSSNGDIAAIAAPDFTGLNRIYTTTGGPLTAHEFGPMKVFEASVGPDAIGACAGLGTNMMYLRYEFRESLPIWTTEFVAPNVLAQLDFDCDVVEGTITAIATTNFQPIPAVTGVGMQVHVRGTTWDTIDVGRSYWSGMDLAAVGPRLIHLAEGGNGTSSSEPRNATELRTHGDDVLEDWELFWGNFGREQHFIESPNRILINAQMWANPPFEYAGSGDTEGVTWAVMDVPHEDVRARV